MLILAGGEKVFLRSAIWSQVKLGFTPPIAGSLSHWHRPMAGFGWVGNGRGGR